jgi:hypothetical protein
LIPFHLISYLLGIGPNPQSPIPNPQNKKQYLFNNLEVYKTF